MKIALYQPWIYLHGGLERSLLELVTRSRHQWVVYTGHYEPDHTFAEFANVDVRVLNATSVTRTIGATLMSAIRVGLQKIPDDEQFDAVVVWCDGIGDLITLRNHRAGRPMYNICSTPLRAAFDPIYEQQTLHERKLSYVFAYQCFKHLFRLIDRVAWSYYDGIIVTSREVRARILYGGLCRDDGKMTMAYPGVQWEAQLSGISYQPFILLPGRIMWTKNLQLGIESFLRADLPAPWRLVVAGFVDRKSAGYLEQLRRMVPEGAAVEFVVNPSDAELQTLYRACSFCLFTPRNEDWGIVPLEAMNHAKAVVANASGGPLESVVSGSTGVLIEAADADDWSEVIRELAHDAPRCQRMGQAGHAHVQQFSWERFVSRVDDALDLGLARRDNRLQLQEQQS